MAAVRRAAVIGTGTMGPGMGAVLARCGIETALYDVSAEALERAKGGAELAAGVLERLDAAHEDGLLLNDTLLDYRVTSFEDLPDEMTCVIVENGDGPGPYGAKGCGEGALAAVPAAIVNALADAGVPMTDLPLTPERVWRRIQELKKEGKWGQ